MKPEELLKKLKDQRPHYNKFVNKYFSQERKDKYRDYCFMPLEMWMLSFNFVPGEKMDKEDTFKLMDRIVEDEQFIQAVSLFSIVATWSYSKSIYRFDKELFEQLKDTKISSNIPIEVFRRIPEYCIYIETPDFIQDGEVIYGFWVTFQNYMANNAENLIMILNKRKENGEEYMNIVSLLSIENEKAHIIDQVDEKNRKVDKHLYLSLLLYICSENCEYSDSESVPSKYKPEKVQGGFRYIQPSQTRIRKIGFKIGETIRNFKKEYRELEHTKRRPHMRRAHWHGYWIGKRGNQEFIYNWIPPTFVNNLEEEEI